MRGSCEEPFRNPPEVLQRFSSSTYKCRRGALDGRSFGAKRVGRCVKIARGRRGSARGGLHNRLGKVFTTEKRGREALGVHNESVGFCGIGSRDVSLQGGRGGHLALRRSGHPWSQRLVLWSVAENCDAHQGRFIPETRSSWTSQLPAGRGTGPSAFEHLPGLGAQPADLPAPATPAQTARWSESARLA